MSARHSERDVIHKWKLNLGQGVGFGEVWGLEKKWVLQGVGGGHDWKTEPVSWKKSPEPNGVNFI